MLNYSYGFMNRLPDSREGNAAQRSLGTVPSCLTWMHTGDGARDGRRVRVDG